MIVQKLAIYAVLGLTYLGLALGYIPGVRMNRATIALVGSSFLAGLGALTHSPGKYSRGQGAGGRGTP